MLSAVLGEGVVHVTSLSLMVTLVYLVLRRWNPAAGAMSAAKPLIVMAIVSARAFCPWPLAIRPEAHAKG